MVPDRPIARFISRFFFSCEAATLAPLSALLDPSLLGAEWLTNFRVAWTGRGLAALCFRLAARLGLRDVLVGSVATPQVVFFQNSTYGVHRSETSLEAQDRSLSGAFCAWCLAETERYRK